MQDKLEIFKIWVPLDTIWAPWAKPVLFADLDTIIPKKFNPIYSRWSKNVDHQTLVILDLPGEEGVLEALDLAKQGYRPVPLYNGVKGPIGVDAVVDVNEIQAGLIYGAEELAKLNIANDAPPVFMLDSQRMVGSTKEPGRYDNRWCVFPQDMPSGNFLIKNGIKKIVVHAPKINIDLSHILLRYQELGIIIYLCDHTGVLRETTITKPSKFKAFSYRFTTLLGFTRNSAGGFGGKIPEPTQYSGGYHGIG